MGIKIRPEDVEALARYTAGSRRLTRRMKAEALLDLSRGKDELEVAQDRGIGLPALRDLMHLYNEGGLKALGLGPVLPTRPQIAPPGSSSKEANPVPGQHQSRVLDPPLSPRSRVQDQPTKPPPAPPQVPPHDPKGPTRRPFHGFDAEREAYARRKDQLLSRAAGRYVVLVGEEMEGPFDSADDARQAGYARWGLGPLYVKQVTVDEPVVAAPPGVIL